MKVHYKKLLIGFFIILLNIIKCDTPEPQYIGQVIVGTRKIHMNGCEILKELLVPVVFNKEIINKEK
jgi:hypothetical protein